MTSRKSQESDDADVAAALAENDDLRKALSRIAGMPVPPRPDSYGASDLQWALRHIEVMRRIAKSAISSSDKTSGKVDF